MTDQLKRKEFDEDGFLELITHTIEDAGGTYCIQWGDVTHYMKKSRKWQRLLKRLNST